MEQRKLNMSLRIKQDISSLDAGDGEDDDSVFTRFYR